MRSRRPGFALLSALWFMVLLGTLGLQIALHAKAWRRTAIVRLDDAAAEQLAHALVERAKAIVSERARAATDPASPVLDDPWQRSDLALSDTLCLMDRCGRLDVWDSGERLHVGFASLEDLERLFSALRMDAGRGARLAAAIVDWQDGDQLRRPRGAERAEYMAGRSRSLPFDGPVSAVEELIDVVGMDRATMHRIRPYLTVAGRGTINVNTAATEVLSSVDGFNPELVAQIQQLQRSGVHIRSVDHLLELVPRHLRDGLVARRALWERRVTFRQENLEFETVLFEGRTERRGTARGGMARFATTVLVIPQRSAR